MFPETARLQKFWTAMMVKRYFRRYMRFLETAQMKPLYYFKNYKTFNYNAVQRWRDFVSKQNQIFKITEGQVLQVREKGYYRPPAIEIETEDKEEEEQGNRRSCHYKAKRSYY